MPSKTPKQAKFMRAIAHGWKPSRMESPPSRAVAREFVEADKKYSGGFAENRYYTGGLAAMDEVNSGLPETLNWQMGGGVWTPLNEEEGPMNYYQEGGAARPGHAEGPNPYEGDPLLKKSYARWERKHHVDPPPPPPPPEAAATPEEVPWWKKLMGYEAGPTRTDEELEAIGQAYGGRVGYQVGGLAIAAPRGGVPPWAEPVQEYQFGGMAARLGPAMRGANRMRQQYRGVPPQRGRIQRGAPGGGGRGGALQQAMMQMRQQRGAPRGRGLPPGIDPRAVAANPEGYAQWAGDPRSAGARGVGLSPYEEMENQRRGPRGPLAPGGGGGPLQLPGGGGRFPDWRQRGTIYDPAADPMAGGKYPGRRIAPPPGKFPRQPVQPGGPGGPLPGGGGGFEPGGGVPGGPRVPPNMRGYLQRQRMMNRPPRNVGGGANRVGMQDQQGGMARALQRGTGRPPMSRRAGFPGRNVR